MVDNIHKTKSLKSNVLPENSSNKGKGRAIETDEDQDEPSKKPKSDKSEKLTIKYITNDVNDRGEGPSSARIYSAETNPSNETISPAEVNPSVEQSADSIEEQRLAGLVIKYDAVIRQKFTDIEEQIANLTPEQYAAEPNYKEILRKVHRLEYIPVYNEYFRERFTPEDYEKEKQAEKEKQPEEDKQPDPTKKK